MGRKGYEGRRTFFITTMATEPLPIYRRRRVLQRSSRLTALRRAWPTTTTMAGWTFTLQTIRPRVCFSKIIRRDDSQEPGFSLVCVLTKPGARKEGWVWGWGLLTAEA